MTATVPSNPIERIPEPQVVRERLARNLREKDILVRLLKVSELVAESPDSAGDGETVADA